MESLERTEERLRCNSERSTFAGYGIEVFLSAVRYRSRQTRSAFNTRCRPTASEHYDAGTDGTLTIIYKRRNEILYCKTTHLEVIRFQLSIYVPCHAWGLNVTSL